MIRIFAPIQPTFRGERLIIALPSCQQEFLCSYRVSNPGVVEDLVHEEQLDAPVLQLLLARLVPSSPGLLGLAVLHPRKLVVYELVPHGE